MAWIINSDGFFSVVKKDCKPDELLVRARVLDDLNRLVEKLSTPTVTIIETPMVDYRYRMTVNAKAFAEYLRKAALAIDYDNFKASLPHDTPADRKRARAYADVWGALYQLQSYN